MSRNLLLTGLAFFISVSAGLYAQAPMTDPENSLLDLALEKNFAGSRHTVVNPDVKPEEFFSGDKGPDGLKRTLREHPALKGLETDALVDRFLERNSAPFRLTLPSYSAHGYVVDYDGKYAAYIAPDPAGDGWKKWRKENPQAHGWTGVSVPVLDQETGLVMVYMSSRFGRYVGVGYFIVYRCREKKLAELTRVMLWMLKAPAGSP